MASIKWMHFCVSLLAISVCYEAHFIQGRRLLAFNNGELRDTSPGHSPGIGHPPKKFEAIKAPHRDAASALSPQLLSSLDRKSKSSPLAVSPVGVRRTPTHYLAAFTGVSTHRQSPAHRSVSHSHRPLLRPWFFSFTSQGVFLPIPLSAFQNPKSDSPNSI
nr:hypothetical protein Iba_chr07bCG15380 [Ipomoea batatas]